MFILVVAAVGAGRPSRDWAACGSGQLGGVIAMTAGRHWRPYVRGLSRSTRAEVAVPGKVALFPQPLGVSSREMHC